MSVAVAVKRTKAVKKIQTPEAQLKALSMKLMKLHLEMRPINEAMYEIQEKRKQYEDAENHIKAMFGAVAEEYYKQTGEKKLENHLVALTYVAPHTASRLDSARLKAEQPKIAAKYMTTSDVKGSVRIKLK